MQVKTKTKPQVFKTAFSKVRSVADNARPLFWQIGIFALGILCANTQILGSARPLALALAAGTQSAWALAAAAGAALGYSLSLDIGTAAPYLCAICACAAVRALYSQHSAKATKLCGICTAVALILGKVLLGIVRDEGFMYMLVSVIEGAVCIGGAYLVRELMAGIGKPRDKSQSELAAFGWAMCILTLSPLNIGGIALSRVVMGVAVLIAAYKGSRAQAAIMGVMGAGALLLVSPANAAAAIGIAVGGVIAATVSGERTRVCALYLVSALVGVCAEGEVRAGVLMLMELCMGGAVFLVLPERFILGTTALRDEGEARRVASVELSGRVSELAASLGDIGCTLGEVFERLPKKGEGYADVCTKVADSVCAKCKKRMECWIDDYSGTMSAMQAPAAKLAQGEGIIAGDLPEALLKKCLAPDKLASGLTREYEALGARKEVRYQGEIMREALTEQYASIAAALEGFGKKLWREDEPDEKKSARIDALFYGLGVNTFSSRVALDKGGCMRVSVKLPRLTLNPPELKVISAEISDICSKHFDVPTLKQASGYTILEMCEKALFAPSFAKSGIAAQEGVSGDAVRSFCDEYGNAHAILCDGMGTGKAAAVDGLLAASLTSRLIRAGFAAREAARLVNVALTLKGEDEAGAALDVLSVNLYTGEASLFKAGAAASYIVHAGTARRIGEDSLPIGILGKVLSQEESFSLKRGDTVILASDGVNGQDGAWLVAMLESTCNDEPRLVCDKIAQEASRRCKDKPDDITVLAVRMV